MPVFSQQVTLRSEFESPDELKNRIEITAGSVEVFGIDVSRGGNTVYQAAGIQTDWVTIGPLYSKGLLREIFNPLGYGPYSSVFREVSGLNPERSFKGSSKKGLALGLPSGCLSWFMLENSYGMKTGAILILPLYLQKRGCFRTQLLCCTSEPPRDSVPSSWFPDKLLYPGDRLVNLACRLSLDHSFLFGSVSTGFSAGKRVRPALFIDLALVADPGMYEAGISIGISSAGYFNPDGKWNRRAVAACFDLWLLPFDLFKLGGEYQCNMDHPSGWMNSIGLLSSLANRTDYGFCLPDCFFWTEKIILKSAVDFPFADDFSADLLPGYEIEREHTKLGEVDVSRVFRLEGNLNLMWFSTSVSVKLEKVLEVFKAAFIYDYYPDWLEIALHLDRLPPVGHIPDITLKVTVEIEDSFWIKLEFYPESEEKSEMFLFSLGCEITFQEREE